ncbi:MAG: hypothetical protein HZA50_14860 [Planctomycetes bacterium]|nr:hypothetical protein [Planctomycetota bacterium]
MSITFPCEHCHKEIKAPDSAGGKRSKCPFCHQSTYIPCPVSENDVLPLADDEEDIKREQAELKKLREQERRLLAELGSAAPAEPLEKKKDLKAEDVHHFVVNFCLDMEDGNLERAQKHAADLKKFGLPGVQAVEDFISGAAKEDALRPIPPGVLKDFLAQLRGKLI